MLATIRYNDRYSRLTSDLLEVEEEHFQYVISARKKDSDQESSQIRFVMSKSSLNAFVGCEYNSSRAPNIR